MQISADEEILVVASYVRNIVVSIDRNMLGAMVCGPSLNLAGIPSRRPFLGFEDGIDEETIGVDGILVRVALDVMADQLIQDYEEGKLDNDPGVQAFVEEWDRKWNSKPYSTIPGRLLRSNAMGMGKKLLGFDVKEQSKSACEWLRIPGNFGQGN